MSEHRTSARGASARAGAARPAAQPDGATVEVVRSYLVSAAEEMRATLVRTAFNPVIYEVLDFGISIYDARCGCRRGARADALPRGQRLRDRARASSTSAGQPPAGRRRAAQLPVLERAPTPTTRRCSRRCSDEPRPAAGAFLCVRAHWLDLGAKDPGYVLDSTDMHQEGLIFPGTKVVQGAAGSIGEILELIRFNSRHARRGDRRPERADRGAAHRRAPVAASSSRSSAGRRVDACVDAILDHGERLAAPRVAAMPEGSWTAVDWLDDDGITRRRRSACR